MSRLEYIRANREKIQEILRKHGVIYFQLFGSVVRGEDGAESDVDFLVRAGDSTSPWFPAGLVLDLEEFLGAKVDVVTEKGLNPLIRDTVLREAVQI